MYNRCFNKELFDTENSNNENTGSYLSGIPSEMLEHEFDFRILGANSSITKDLRVSKLLEFIKLTSTSALIAGKIDVIEMVKTLYRELGFKDENRIFNQKGENNV
jgi:hypothetical protein